MKRIWTLGVALLIVVLLTGCSGGTGSLLIETDPPGADVYIGSRHVGTTPLLIPDVSAGTARLTIKKPGYENKNVSISVRDGKESVISEELIPTFEYLVNEVTRLGRPEAPVQMYMMKLLGVIEAPSNHYWHPLTHYGIGEFSISMVEGVSARRSAERLTKDEAKAQAQLLGLPSLWTTRLLEEDAALVHSPRLDITAFVAKEDGAWKLMRTLNDDEHFETVSLATVLANTEKYLMAITGTDTLLEVLEDSDSHGILETPEASTTPKWTTIKRWSGNGTKQTETFEVTNHEWQIEWSAANENLFGYLGVYLYKENGSLVSLPVNQTGEGKGSTYVRGAGRYYLDILGANIDWEVKVLDYK